MTIVGRHEERRRLDRALGSGEAELVAIYGRRRVGKTFLVREHLGAAIRFELTGSHGAPLPEQLGNFASALAIARGGARPTPPASWVDAFGELRGFLEGLGDGQKQVVFFDELPWLASRRSGLLRAFEHFWNAWGSRRRNLVVVVCGSAASWMVSRVVRARGGLHNRVTARIQLAPFTLAETREYLGSRGPDPGPHQTLELYMALGGVPFYLREVTPGDSAAQAIDRLCFRPTGLLQGEFAGLYASLFEHAERHEQVVRALGRRPGGMTRGELIEASGGSSGGGISAILAELEASGFVLRTASFGRHVRDAVYRLVDEYSLFYLRWVERSRGRSSTAWATRRGTPAWRAWSGTAFEGICLKHIVPLKRALGIEGVETVESCWTHRAGDGAEGAQIDLLIDRKDDCINVCEMKMTELPFSIDKRYAADLRRKLAVFREVTGTTKALLCTMVTTRGVAHNSYHRELVARDVTIDELCPAPR